MWENQAPVHSTPCAATDEVQGWWHRRLGHERDPQPQIVVPGAEDGFSTGVGSSWAYCWAWTEYRPSEMLPSQARGGGTGKGRLVGPAPFTQLGPPCSLGAQPTVT